MTADNQANRTKPQEPEASGIVVCNFGSQLDIKGLDGRYKGTVHRCHKKATLDTVVAGDRVIWQHGDPYGIVLSREARTSKIVRPDTYGKIRTVAANIDRIAIVFACIPKPSSQLIDRYLVAAETQNIQPVLIVNKIDEDYHFKPVTQKLVRNYADIGYRVVLVSAKTGEGIKELKKCLCNCTSIFVGQSGVGKSSLINHLHPEAHAAVSELSRGNQKGVHTTTTSRLYDLSFGGQLIDSPGIREFSLGHLNREDVVNGFIDFRPFLGNCKFRDCSHQNEIGCALHEAVKNHLLIRERLDSFHEIIIGLGKN